MASDVATMLPTMIFEPERAGACLHRERLGQPAGLVELDVHRVVARGERLERGAVMHRLVGADRNGSVDVLQEFVVAGGQRLLDQLDAGPWPRLEQVLQRLRSPGLVGIGDEPRLWRGLAHGGEPLASPSPPSLSLSRG